MHDHRISHFWKISEERRFWLWLSEKGGQSFDQNGLLFDLVDKRRRGKNWGYLFEPRIPSVCKIKSSAPIKFALLLKLLFFRWEGVEGLISRFIFCLRLWLPLQSLLVVIVPRLTQYFSSTRAHYTTLFAETTRTMWLTHAALSGDQR